MEQTFYRLEYRIFCSCQEEEALMQIIENAVAGKRYVSSSTRRVPVFNPATGEQSAELPLSTLSELNEAVATAKKAQVAWGNTPPMKRARVMFKFKALLDQYADDIAREISKEHGKVHDDALGEVARGIDCVDFACGIPQLLKGEFSRNVGPNIDTYSDRQPLAWLPASPRSTSRPWCRCGCIRPPSPAAMPSF
jgi:malonate-semialdehyde dehydrogenase (acetylating)/methylmalonate-semialdehyde dehydrogenase